MSYPRKNTLVWVALILSMSLEASAADALRFIFEGNSAIADAELLEPLGDLNAELLSSEKLQEIEQEIFNVYASKGYIARVKIPDQLFDDMSIRVEIFESRLDSVTIDAPEGIRFSQQRVERMVENKLSGNTILTVDALESAAKVVDNIAGLNTEISLRRGQEDATEAVVSLKQSDLFALRGQVDNYSTEAVGDQRYSLFSEFNSLLYLGETISLGAVKTEGSDFFSIDATFPWLDDGSKIMISGRYSNYEITNFDIPVEIFEGFSGSSDTEILTYFFPEYDYSELLLESSLGFGRTSAQDLLDFTGGPSIASDDKLIKYFTLDQSVSWESPVNRIAVNALFKATFGDLTYEAPNKKLNDALTAKSEGRFVKLNMDTNIQYAIGEKSNLTVLASAQMSNKNLDRLQEIVATGPAAVRAFDSGLFSADNGVLLRADWNHVINEKVNAFTFLDAAWMRTHKSPWDGWNASNSDANEYSIFGGGVGVNINITPSLTWNLQYARKINECDACALDEKSDQFWSVLTWTP